MTDDRRPRRTTTLREIHRTHPLPELPEHRQLTDDEIFTVLRAVVRETVRRAMDATLGKDDDDV